MTAMSMHNCFFMF